MTDEHQIRKAWNKLKGVNEAGDEYPVIDVLQKYSAIPSGHGTFSAPRQTLSPPSGSKRPDPAHILDNCIGLIQGVALTRGGQSQVVQRDDAEGGVIIRISLPASGILMPSGVNEVWQQIVSVVRQEYPMNVVLDCVDVRSVGLGSPVSANDSQHILTARVLAKLPQNISRTNNLYNRDTTRRDE